MRLRVLLLLLLCSLPALGQMPVMVSGFPQSGDKIGEKFMESLRNEIQLSKFTVATATLKDYLHIDVITSEVRIQNVSASSVISLAITEKADGYSDLLTHKVIVLSEGADFANTCRTLLADLDRTYTEHAKRNRFRR